MTTTDIPEGTRSHKYIDAHMHALVVCVYTYAEIPLCRQLHNPHICNTVEHLADSLLISGERLLHQNTPVSDLPDQLRGSKD